MTSQRRPSRPPDQFVSGRETASADSASTPWLCRAFGHHFITRPTGQINTTRWQQPASIPTFTYCRRCGTTTSETR